MGIVRREKGVRSSSDQTSYRKVSRAHDFGDLNYMVAVPGQFGSHISGLWDFAGFWDESSYTILKWPLAYHVDKQSVKCGVK